MQLSKGLMARALSQGAAAAPGPGTPGFGGASVLFFLVGRMNKLSADDRSFLEARGMLGFLAPVPASCALPAGQEAGLATAGTCVKSYHIQTENSQDKGAMREGNCWWELATD